MHDGTFENSREQGENMTNYLSHFSPQTIFRLDSPMALHYDEFKLEHT
jgi:hypothetical protein